MLKNIFRHIKTVTKHRWVVFKLCCRVGIPWRGFVHDLSKFSWAEFYESVKFYKGTRSPLSEAKEQVGYSKAWLHHRGRNKHHVEYWVDTTAPQVAPVIPYKYIVETVCDNLSAGIVYKGKDWTTSTVYDYWTRAREKVIVNPKIDKFLTHVFTEVKEKGIKPVLTKKNMKKWYKEFCIDDKTEYKYEFEKGIWRKV